MNDERAAAVAALRRHIAEVAPHRPARRFLPTGIARLDERIGGFGALTVISGAAGTGRWALVLPAIQALTRSDRTVAIVDVRGWFHPPGLHRVDLSRILLVRPGPDRALWAAEQLARSSRRHSSSFSISLVRDAQAVGSSRQRSRDARP
jgi:hypothetical protein